MSSISGEDVDPSLYSFLASLGLMGSTLDVVCQKCRGNYCIHYCSLYNLNSLCSCFCLEEEIDLHTLKDIANMDELKDLGLPMRYRIKIREIREQSIQSELISCVANGGHGADEDAGGRRVVDNDMDMSTVDCGRAADGDENRQVEAGCVSDNRYYLSIVMSRNI